MKKIALILAIFAIASSSAKAERNKIIHFSQLPEPAQEFVQTHFAGNDVAITNRDRNIFEQGYEIIFVDGKKVEFDKNGLWKQVDCSHDRVPENIVPEQISAYVSEKYPSAEVIQIERDRDGIEVELSNNFELEFDNLYNLVGIEN